MGDSFKDEKAAAKAGNPATAAEPRPARDGHFPPGVDSPAQRAVFMRKARERVEGRQTNEGAVAAAAATPGEPLAAATRSQLEPAPALGADLGGVRVHTGGASAAAADSIAARAYTDGQDIHFGAGEYQPGSREGDRLIAHEVTHTAQASKGGIARKADSDVSQPGDPAEVEADRVADAVVGAGAAPTGPLHAAAAPLARAPQNPMDLGPAGATTTTHGAPTLDDGYGHDYDATHGGAAGVSQPMDVTLLHTEDAPLKISGVPSAAQLYLQTPAGFGGGTHVDGRIGSVDRPYVKEAVDPEVIFVGGNPVDEDVRQGQIGDCYLMAVMHQMTTRDPAKIKTVMAPSAGACTVNLFRFDSGTNTYVASPVTVDKTLAHDKDVGTGAALGLHGAGFHVGPAPVRSEWYCKVVGTTLGLVRKDYYETGMWAPLMEKAYARYCELYGQYGGVASGSNPPNAQTDAAGTALSGYSVADGGWENMVYNSFYGSSVVSHGQTSTNFVAGGNIVAANLPAMTQLLQLQGKGLGAGQQMMLTASAYYGDLFNRTSQLVALALAEPHAKHYPHSFNDSLHYVDQLVAAWNTVSGDATKEPKAKNKVAREARAVAKPGAWPFLQRATASAALKNLLELLDDIANAGTDGDPGQRFIYSEHAYSIMSLVLRDKSGTVLDLNPTTLAAQAANVDADQSTIVIRNPHGENEPDVHGNKKPDDGSKSDGIFTINLSQFFRSYSTLDFAVVQH